MSMRLALCALVGAACLLTCCACFGQQGDQDRQPAVAGQFYPGTRDELRTTLSSLFATALPSRQLTTVLAIIAPHAGYVFSGGVAASAYRQVDQNKSFENVFVIGVSHHAAYEGAALYLRGSFVTPLGKLAVNQRLSRELMKKDKVFVERYDAHDQEHSIEVQLPFLQYYLKKPFQLVPVLIGAQSPETCKRIAAVLRPYLTERNLFVVSTDFSHYPSAEDAQTVDRIAVKAIASNSPAAVLQSIVQCEQKGIRNLATSMCGWSGVLTLMYMTEGEPGLVVTPIQYKNSGDSPYGNKDQVVGYHAIAFSVQEENQQGLNPGDKKALLKLARSTLEEYLRANRTTPPDVQRLPAAFRVPSGAFVTLKKEGELRGCIGQFEASTPLWETVQNMAIAAGTQDPRFTPVVPGELASLEVEISVLTPMRKVRSIGEIELGKHGIYIRKGNRGGTFLPQVATETGWTKEEFLGHCAQDKAGIGWDGWKDAELYVYEAIVFSEHDSHQRP